MIRVCEYRVALSDIGVSARAHLGNDATPGDDLRIDLFARLSLVVHDGLKQTVQTLVDTVVVFDELVKALGQVHAQLGRVVPSQRLVANVKFVLLIVREAGEFLGVWSDILALTHTHTHTHVVPRNWDLVGLPLACGPAHFLWQSGRLA